MPLSPKNSEVQVDLLPVMEEFYTIQGEGAHTGTAAYFIRLGGCDVGCVWCDVKDSWDASAHPKKTITDFADISKSSFAEVVVITFVEPSMYNFYSLTSSLLDTVLITHF